MTKFEQVTTSTPRSWRTSIDWIWITSKVIFELVLAFLCLLFLWMVVFNVFPRNGTSGACLDSAQDLYRTDAASGFISGGEKAGDKLHPDSTVRIYLKTDRVHTDFILPVSHAVFAWDEVIPSRLLRDSSSTYSYISFGWGSLDFFVNTPEWSDLTLRVAFDAAFYRGKSALHVNYTHLPFVDANCVALEVSAVEYRRLIAYIRSSFEGGSAESSFVEDKGYWLTDGFFVSGIPYGLLYSCNSWINTGLREAGLPSVSWTLVGDGLIEKYACR